MAPFYFPPFLKRSAKYCSSLPHTPFGLILFYMAPKHQQREHEGSGETERERGEKDRVKKRGLEEEGVEEKGRRKKKQKGRHKSWRKYVGLRQQQRPISSRNAVIISLSPLPSFCFLLHLSASLILAQAKTVQPPSEYIRGGRQKNKQKKKKEGTFCTRR